MSFEIFLGIDQAEAAAEKGHSRPLPTAAIYKSGSHWILESDLSISGLNKRNIESLIKDLNPQHKLSSTIILLDSVLGLPKGVFPKNKNIFELMQRAHRFSDDGRKLGPKTAHAFFAQFLEKTSDPHPRRECERIASASSIFQTPSAPKNISTGTFRSWTELGSSKEKWFSLWPMDDLHHQRLHLHGPWIFEAHPDLLWKKIIKSNSRDTESLKNFLAAQKFVKLHPSVLRSPHNLNFCDAIILAYSGLLFHKRKRLFRTPKVPSLKKEGWILGL
ncbi:hypothetical protein [Bdellovibrio svalbardensis]|uniref:DUF429 domain-containing protein n=1 Tax=Bdellovibrio svalbardensis TaxID=2972972 RepID=A0ABT6DEE3_9BACT|nr:hypothetical protein [Bdellovibrio svalbardensis]MDG0815200.1 hypothetical protein [Bdellovibrio svalbardensis]